MEKARECQRNIYFCFIGYAKAFDCVDHNKLWKILKEMGMPDHLTCLLRNLYTGNGATKPVRRNYCNPSPAVLKPTCLEPMFRSKRNPAKRRPSTATRA